VADRGVTVVLADDHAATRAGVRLVLEGAGFTVLADAGTADSAVEATLRHRPALCLLDLYMPGDGICAVRRIYEEAPDTKIVVLTGSAAPIDFFDAITAGASGYLLKGAPGDWLPAALQAVARGEAALPRRLERCLIDEFRGHELSRRIRRPRLHPHLDGPGHELTAREWEVLELIAEHLPTAVVARRLAISDVTVRRHISSAVHKLGVADRERALELLNSAGTGRPEESGP
jgi:DNA-binding NarL/FixJ family response regulator